MGNIEQRFHRRPAYRARSAGKDTEGAEKNELQGPVKNPARFPRHEVSKVAHCWLEVNGMTRPMQVREDEAPYGD